MAKQPSYKSNAGGTPTGSRAGVKKDNANDEGGKFVDRDLTKDNPLSQQFEPTDSEAVRQRYKMGGGS